MEQLSQGSGWFKVISFVTQSSNKAASVSLGVSINSLPGSLDVGNHWRVGLLQRRLRRKNTASGVGQYLRSGNSGVVANVYGSIPSTSSFSVSWGGSGSTVSCTVTNNTSDWWYWVPFYQPNGTARYQPFYTNYFDSGSNNQFTLQTNWGGTGTTQKFGQNTRHMTQDWNSKKRS